MRSNPRERNVLLERGSCETSRSIGLRTSRHDEILDFARGFIDPKLNLAIDELHVNRKMIDAGDRVQIKQKLLG